jgi:hypothetical protein
VPRRTNMHPRLPLALNEASSTFNAKLFYQDLTRHILSKIRNTCNLNSGQNHTFWTDRRGRPTARPRIEAIVP